MSIDILSAAGRGRLRRHCLPSTLVALDFDGTLAPIVAAHDHARVSERTKTLLCALAERYPSAVISGRARGDVIARLSDCKVQQVFGNHGIEPSPQQAWCAALINELQPLLEARLRCMPGIEIEDKQYSLSVHYRYAPQREHALATIEDAVASLPPGLRAVHGKLVLNLVPIDSPHKGDALLRAWINAKVDHAVYIGDDITDEDAFHIRDRRLLSIRVGGGRSAARHHLKDHACIDRLLTLLIHLRTHVSAA